MSEQPTRSLEALQPSGSTEPCPRDNLKVLKMPTTPSQVVDSRLSLASQEVMLATPNPVTDPESVPREEPMHRSEEQGPVDSNTLENLQQVSNIRDVVRKDLASLVELITTLNFNLRALNEKMDKLMSDVTVLTLLMSQGSSVLPPVTPLEFNLPPETITGKPGHMPTASSETSND